MEIRNRIYSLVERIGLNIGLNSLAGAMVH